MNTDTTDGERREYLIDWASRRGPAQFGWYRFIAPRWWPRREPLHGALMALVAICVKARFAAFPPPPPPSEDDVDPAALSALLDDVSHDLPMQLAPVGHRAGTVSVGFSGDMPEDERALADLVRSRGLQVDPEHWRSGFALRPVTAPLPWTPDFDGFSTVGGLVGRGFEAYVRILHPLEACDERGHIIQRTPWREIDGARLDDPAWRPDRRLDGSIDYDMRFPQDAEASEGAIPDVVRTVMVELLHHDLDVRGDESLVVQGLWEGFNLNLESATEERVHQPGRDIVPFMGAFDDIVRFDAWRTPSIVFPTSGAWCLANDTDLVSTYVGCDEALARTILADERLECRRVEAGDPLG